MTARKRTLPPFLFQALLLIVITTVTFLPNLSRATIFRDDWYYTLDRYYGGPQAFHEMFTIDRPARGYFFEAYYQLFGIEPAPYHAAGFVLRVLMGLGALWLFHLLWPKKRQAVFLISALFVLYPGYTRWMEGFENQPNVATMVLLVVSIALTLEAMRASNFFVKILLWLGAILTGWVYIALIDYAIGMEAFRFLCMLLFLHHRQPALPLRRNGGAFLRRFARSGFPALLVSGVFLYWRLFIFKNARMETDIKHHLKQVLEEPLQGITGWFTGYIKSVLNAGVLGWVPPSFQELFAWPGTDTLLGLLLAAFTAALVIAGAAWLRSADTGAIEPEAQGSSAWHEEAIWLGLLGVLAGVIPVVLANRTVAFGVFSHYTVPTSLAAAPLMVGMLYTVASRRKRLALVFVLVLLAVSTHFSESLKVVREEQTISNFWQQAAWRVPGIREATGLLVHYPNVSYGEDIDAVQGPANFIYFPEPKSELPVRYSLYAMKHYPWTVKEFLAGGKSLRGYRTHLGVIDFNAVLVLTQPSPEACVRVIDKRYPYYANDDHDRVVIVGESSDTRHILVDAEPPVLRETIFGPEPEHGWCYYFEKADLALQTGDYAAVQQWGAEAQALGLEPAEPLEWMPFLQAQAALGNHAETAALIARVAEGDYHKAQSCRALQQMEQQVAPFDAAIHALIDKNLCQRPQD